LQVNDPKKTDYAAYLAPDGKLPGINAVVLDEKSYTLESNKSRL
jgi:hypothetical protein